MIRQPRTDDATKAASRSGIRRTMCAAVLTTLVFGVLPLVNAQAQEKTKIAFQCQCSQPVAAMYASKVRDLLAISPRYVEGKFSDKEPEGWKLSVVTTNIPSGDLAPSSVAMSIVLTLGGFLVSHDVQVCGTQKVDVCASTTLADLDSDIQSSPFSKK
jgi:hypothetical protein